MTARAGILPGGGATQRLTRAIGASRAMEYILTGKNFTAQQAAEWGLASRVITEDAAEGEQEAVVAEAVKVAEAIAGKSTVAVQAAKAATKAGECFFGRREATKQDR